MTGSSRWPWFELAQERFTGLFAFHTVKFETQLERATITQAGKCNCTTVEGPSEALQCNNQLGVGQVIAAATSGLTLGVGADSVMFATCTA